MTTEADNRGGAILVVDDARENLRLLCAILKRGGLVPRPVTSGQRAIEAAAADPPDLFLLDVRLPGMSGFEVCRWLKQDERFRATPVIFISGLQAPEDRVEAFRVGGVDYISKPFQEEEVLARITTHLRLRRLQADLVSQNERLEQRVEQQLKAVTASQLAIIFALAKLAEARDDDTGQHIERVQTFARMLGVQMREMGQHSATLTPSFVDTVSQTAALHDVGKVAIADAVLLKPGKLTPDEFAEMKKHAALGATTLDTVLHRYPDNQFLRIGVEVARSHHERWDGRGYPDGLKETAIPLSARLVALADVYDALTSNRCYRPAMSHEESRAMIEAGAGTQFDPEVTAAFSVQEARFKRVRQEMEDR